ncbi:unnamed protein product, partial [marine sediment metagenome]
YHRELDKIIDLQKQKAEIWNKIRGYIVKPTNKTLWQLAVGSPNLITKTWGKETHLSFYAKDIDKLLAQPPILAKPTPAEAELVPRPGETKDEFRARVREAKGIKVRPRQLPRAQREPAPAVTKEKALPEQVSHLDWVKGEKFYSARSLDEKFWDWYNSVGKVEARKQGIAVTKDWRGNWYAHTTKIAIKPAPAVKPKPVDLGPAEPVTPKEVVVSKPADIPKAPVKPVTEQKPTVDLKGKEVQVFF